MRDFWLVLQLVYGDTLPGLLYLLFFPSLVGCVCGFLQNRSSAWKAAALLWTAYFFTTFTIRGVVGPPGMIVLLWPVPRLQTWEAEALALVAILVGALVLAIVRMLSSRIPVLTSQ